jgi:DNA-binding MarR family transcriptional regulator
MQIQDLIDIGLTNQQAITYSLLVDNGSMKPANVAKQLNLSRTNAYKILDSLVELGLIQKITKSKTITYAPKSPLALANLTSTYRAEAVKREQTAGKLIKEMLVNFSKHTSKPNIELFIGQNKVTDAYLKQIDLGEDIKFIHTKADVPMMGFETMHELRVKPARLGNKRRAIMAYPESGNINYESHKRSKLDITWAETSLYDHPVEWSVTESSLLIASYDREPQAILIVDPTIAAAFSSIWSLLEGYIAKDPTNLKVKAKTS